MGQANKPQQGCLEYSGADDAGKHKSEPFGFQGQTRMPLENLGPLAPDHEMGNVVEGERADWTAVAVIIWKLKI